MKKKKHRKIYVELQAEPNSGYNGIKLIIEDKVNIMTIRMICSLTNQDNKKKENHPQTGKICKITQPIPSLWENHYFVIVFIEILQFEALF